MKLSRLRLGYVEVDYLLSISQNLHRYLDKLYYLAEFDVDRARLGGCGGVILVPNGWLRIRNMCLNYRSS